MARVLGLAGLAGWGRGVAGHALAAGVVGLVTVTALLVVFSEVFYWYSGGLDYPGRVLFYLLPACGLLWTMTRFEVAGWAGVMLAGAVFGFLTEGVLTPIVYGGFPFDPFAISYTSLAWHAVISVGLGLVMLHHVLAAGRVVTALAVVAGLGALWGLWAMTLALPEVVNDPEASGASWLRGRLPVANFLAYTSLFTAVLASCHALLGRALHMRHLRPSRWLAGTLAVLAAAWFAVLTVPSAPWALVELPVLLGICLLALRRVRGRPPASMSALAVLDRAVPWSRLGLLLALPVTATAVYAVAGVALVSADSLRLLQQAMIWTQAGVGWLAFLAALLAAR